MGNMKRVVTIKEYKELNGRQVPIYKYSWVSKDAYSKATEEAMKRLNSSEEPTMDEKELLDTLKTHAEDFQRENERVVVDKETN